MKKLLVMLCAGVMAVSMSVSAFAGVRLVGSSTLKTVRVWDALVVDGSAATKDKVVITAVNEENAKAAAELVAKNGGTTIAVADVNYSPITFVKMKVAFNLKNVVATDSVSVWYKDGSGAWVKQAAEKVENGKATFTFEYDQVHNGNTPMVFVK